LTQAIHDLVKSFPGEAGIAIQSLDEGWVVSERGSQRFPQNSVFKTWLAIAAIDSIERGEHRLDETLHVTRADLVYSHQPLADRVPPSGYDAKLGELLELMITLSDNPSTDLVMARLGGPEAVGKTLEKKGLLPLSPTRDERGLQKQWDELMAGLKAHPEQKEALLRSFFDERANSATPLEAVSALARLVSGELLSSGSTRQLEAWLEATKTGPARLMAGVPKGYRLGHKTGTAIAEKLATLGINDIGLISSPDGHRWAVACFVGRTDAPIERSEQLIADVARALIASASDDPHSAR
jgi:beta-lactamase class A